MIILEQYQVKDLQRMFDVVLDEFRNCEAFDEVFNADCVNKHILLLDKRNKRALGQCCLRRNVSGNEFVIKLSPWLLEFEEGRDKIILDVIAHELLHTFDGCYNHGPNFHRWAKVIYDNFGYLIDTHADTDAGAYFRSVQKPKYKIVCDKCGIETYKDRKSDLTENPINYYCGKCHGGLSSYIRNEQTGEYEPYRSSKDEPKGSNIQILCPDCEWSMGFNRMDDKARTYLSWCLHGGECPRCGATTYAMDNRKGERITFGDIGVKRHSTYRI